jgi:peptide/nickel transport system permease protein
MAGYLGRRIGELLVTLLLITLLVFCLARLTGDPTPLLTPVEATDEDRAFFRKQYGLDRSLPEQYLTFLGNILGGNFGVSFRLREPAIEVVLRALWPTLKLAAAGMALAVVIGLPLGIAAAASSNAWVKRAVGWYGSLGQAMPPFWVGLTLIMFFALWMPVLPTSGYGRPANYVLPALTLAIFASSAVARLTHVNMEEALRSDFVQLERVLGLSDARILLKHALRNAALPIVTYLGLQFGLIISGAIVTERVFAWPGIGQIVVEAVLNRDYPVVQATVLVTALLVMLINLAVDLLYMVLDPRVRS